MDKIEIYNRYPDNPARASVYVNNERTPRASFAGRHEYDNQFFIALEWVKENIEGEEGVNYTVEETEG